MKTGEKMTGFAKPIENIFDANNGIWVSYTEYNGRKFISESVCESEKESETNLIDLIANRIVYNSVEKPKRRKQDK